MRSYRGPKIQPATQSSRGCAALCWDSSHQKFLGTPPPPFTPASYPRHCTPCTSLAKPCNRLQGELPKSNTNTRTYTAFVLTLDWSCCCQHAGGAKQQQCRSRPAGGRCSYLQPPAGGGRLSSQHSCCQEAEVLQMPPSPPPPVGWDGPEARSGRGLPGSVCTSLNGCGSPGLGVHRERTHRQQP